MRHYTSPVNNFPIFINTTTHSFNTKARRRWSQMPRRLVLALPRNWCYWIHRLETEIETETYRHSTDDGCYHMVSSIKIPKGGKRIRASRHLAAIHPNSFSCFWLMILSDTMGGKSCWDYFKLIVIQAAVGCTKML